MAGHPVPKRQQMLLRQSLLQVATQCQSVCTKLGMLNELRICFDKDFKPRECNVDAETLMNDDAAALRESSSSCPADVSLSVVNATAAFVLREQVDRNATFAR